MSNVAQERHDERFSKYTVFLKLPKDAKTWQERHDERFGNYTAEDWEREFEMQRLEVASMRMREGGWR